MRAADRARHVVPISLIATFCCASGLASAWTTATELRVAREAVRLMPLALKTILEVRGAELAAGVREGAFQEGSPEHTLNPGQRGPTAATRLETITSEIVAMIDGHVPFATVARRMGVAAHIVCDLNNPLHVSAEDPGEARYALDYAQYVETNLGKFPLVFYGWANANLDAPVGSRRGGVAAFAAETAQRARSYYAPIGRAYDPAATSPLTERFDVRSLPFGVGSLSYSNSVTDTARLWLHIWKRAHGDLRGTPYLSRVTSLKGARSSPAGTKQK